MTLGELNRILDDWCDIKVVQNDGEGEAFEVTTKDKVDYFNEHSADKVTYISQDKGKILVWTE